MGKDDNIVTQVSIDEQIAVTERQLASYVIKASVQDGIGDWHKAKCLLKEARWAMLHIGVLESTCTDVVIAPEEAPPKKGIGYTPITSPSITYGEFAQPEFLVESITEVTII